MPLSALPLLRVMKAGDWLFMQFGHNDQKQIAAKSGGPFTTYQTEIRTHVEGYAPAHPDNPATFAVPPSGEFTNQRPLGDEGR